MALDPAEETVALKAERAAHAAQLEADAIAAAEARTCGTGYQIGVMRTYTIQSVFLGWAQLVLELQVDSLSLNLTQCSSEHLRTTDHTS